MIYGGFCTDPPTKKNILFNKRADEFQTQILRL